MKKYIPYDYLASKANIFPFIQRIVFERILDGAPFVEEADMRAGCNQCDLAYAEGFDAGYENGLYDGYQLGNPYTEAPQPNAPPKKRRRVTRPKN